MELTKDQQNLNEAKKLKEEADKLSTNNNYEAAIAKYYDCIDFIPDIPKDELNKEFSELDESIRTSLVSCLIANKYYDAAKDECEDALESYPHNTKFKYYLGIALIAQQELNNALLLFKQIKREDPSYEGIDIQIEVIKKIRDECNRDVKLVLGPEIATEKKIVVEEGAEKYNIPKIAVVGLTIAGIILAGVVLYKRYKK
ncbi:unnamed protein product [Blepharisma stoltei]|uniref:Tetratricopeptide repeat protein n=1 Tax=Blepharisma stoltei TaxID=1481888 RepID=A0AAU9K1R3_9CILI|nr:unnamed protein product [Blepharisma stoltei]